MCGHMYFSQTSETTCPTSPLPANRSLVPTSAPFGTVTCQITTGDGIRHLQDRANYGTLGNNEFDHRSRLWACRLLCYGSLRRSVRCALSHSVVQKRLTSSPQKKRGGRR